MLHKAKPQRQRDQGCHTITINTNQGIHLDALINLGSGGWIRTNDLRVMSPTSYLCSTPHSLIPIWKSAAKVLLFRDMTKCRQKLFEKLTKRVMEFNLLEQVFNICKKELTVGFGDFSNGAKHKIDPFFERCNTRLPAKLLVISAQLTLEERESTPQ